ncbi:MAG: hypothetical protein ACK58X_18810, partial [Planctomycetota bacterium]
MHDGAIDPRAWREGDRAEVVVPDDQLDALLVASVAVRFGFEEASCSRQLRRRVDAGRRRRLRRRRGVPAAVGREECDPRRADRTSALV